MYGYLPALIECGAKVALPERYRAVIAGRSELAQYLPDVIWCADIDAALARATGAVIALRPADQAGWLPRLAQAPAIRDLILEKPVAPEPQLATQVLEALEHARKRYRVGYTFRFMPWAARLRTILGEGADGLSLDWSFMAHHYRAALDNWKRWDASGGGALRFYGIHLIALLAELGYDDVAMSTMTGPSEAETSSWVAVFTAKTLPPFALRVDSRAPHTSFSIAASRRGKSDLMVIDQLDPFTSTSSSPNSRDPRVDVLAQLVRSLGETCVDHAQRQRSIIALWGRVEAISRRAAAPGS